MCYRAVVPKSVCKRSRACPASVKARFPSLSLRISQNEFVSHPVSGSRGQEIPRTLPPPSQHALTQSFHPPSNSYGPTSILACVMQPARRHGFRAATAASSACATHEKPRGGETGDGGRPPAHQSPSSLSSGHSLTHSLHSSLSAICQRSAVALTATSCPADQRGGRLLRLSNLLS